MKSLLFITFAIAFASLGFAQKKERPAIYLNADDMLHVQVMEYIGQDHGGRNHRFLNFKASLEKIFEETGFPLDYKITRSGARKVPDGEPRLDITITKWGDNGMSQIEARFMASLKLDSVRNKLGMFYYRGGNSGPTSQISRTYNDVLEKALIKMVSELNRRIVVMNDHEPSELEAGDAARE